MYHVTRDGKSLPIAAMQTTHLINTVRLFLRPLTEATKNINATAIPLSKRARALYGDDIEIDADDYRELNDQTIERVSPYVMELALRGSSHAILSDLREAFGRHDIESEYPTGTAPALITSEDIEQLIRRTHPSDPIIDPDCHPDAFGGCDFDA